MTILEENIMITFLNFKNDFYYIGVNDELCNKAELAGIERKKYLLKNFVDIDIKGLKVGIK